MYRTSKQVPDGQRRRRVARVDGTLIGLISADAKFMNERDEIAEYIGTLKAGEGLRTHKRGLMQQLFPSPNGVANAV